MISRRAFLGTLAGGLLTAPLAREAQQAGKIFMPFLTILLLCAMPPSAYAQVFIASHPQPDFAIGPLFVSASVGKENTGRTPGPLTVTVSWSLALPPQRRATDIAQDLYLLWPAEVAGTPGAAGADPTLVRQVEPLGFRVKEHGSLRLSARSRTEMGTTAGIHQLGEAPFVTFGRESEPAAGARGATFIRIPWVLESASLDWLVRLELPLRGVIATRPVSWLEETFWGRRYIIMLGFGDVGSVALYPLYFGVRDRVVPLARDFSMLLINFGDAGHLKVDEVVPPTATRRTSETRSNTEAFQLPLLVSEGLAPQLLKVQFAYFWGQVPWRPILISALLLGLGNLTGPLVAALLRRLFRTRRAHVHVGRGEAPGREREVRSRRRRRWNVSGLGRRATRTCSGCVARFPRNRRTSRQARHGHWCIAVRRWCPTGGGRLAGLPRSATGTWRTTKSRSTSSATACAISRFASAGHG